MSTTVGTCSICGGRVSVPSVWMSIIPPVPTCESCGAVEAAPHGPVIPMKPNPVRTQTTTTTTIRWDNDWLAEQAADHSPERP